MDILLNYQSEADLRVDINGGRIYRVHGEKKEKNVKSRQFSLRRVKLVFQTDDLYCSVMDNCLAFRFSTRSALTELTKARRETQMLTGVFLFIYFFATHSPHLTQDWRDSYDSGMKTLQYVAT